MCLIKKHWLCPRQVCSVFPVKGVSQARGPPAAVPLVGLLLPGSVGRVLLQSSHRSHPVFTWSTCGSEQRDGCAFLPYSIINAMGLWPASYLRLW